QRSISLLLGVLCSVSESQLTTSNNRRWTKRLLQHSSKGGHDSNFTIPCSVLNRKSKLCRITLILVQTRLYLHNNRISLTSINSTSNRFGNILGGLLADKCSIKCSKILNIKIGRASCR